VGKIDRRMGSQWASELRLGNSGAPTKLSNFLRSNGVDVDSILASHSSALTQTRAENKAFREAISQVRNADGTVNRAALSKDYLKKLDNQEATLKAVRERLAAKGAHVPQSTATHGLPGSAGRITDAQRARIEKLATSQPGARLVSEPIAGQSALSGSDKLAQLATSKGMTADELNAARTRATELAKAKAEGIQRGRTLSGGSTATATPHPQAIAVDPNGVATLPAATTGAATSEKKSWRQRLFGSGNTDNPPQVRPPSPQQQALNDAARQFNQAQTFRQQAEATVRLNVQATRQGVGTPGTRRHNLMTAIQERLAVRTARKNGDFKLPTAQELTLGA